MITIKFIKKENLFKIYFLIEVLQELMILNKYKNYLNKFNLINKILILLNLINLSLKAKEIELMIWLLLKKLTYCKIY